MRWSAVFIKTRNRLPFAGIDLPASQWFRKNLCIKAHWFWAPARTHASLLWPQLPDRDLAGNKKDWQKAPWDYGRLLEDVADGRCNSSTGASVAQHRKTDRITCALSGIVEHVADHVILPPSGPIAPCRRMIGMVELGLGSLPGHYSAIKATCSTAFRTDAAAARYSARALCSVLGFKIQSTGCYLCLGLPDNDGTGVKNIYNIAKLH